MRLGVLDWGIGGLFAVRRVLEKAPGTELLYLSDAGNLPYGRQSAPQLRRSVESALGFLVEQGATELLVACHAASTVLPGLRLGWPVHGVIDASGLPTARLTLVIGGQRTIRSGAWRRALAGRAVLQRVAQPLSAHVEAGRSADSACKADLDRILAPAHGATGVVLACTHYAALAEAIAERMPGAWVVDPAIGVVDRLLDGLPAGVDRPAPRFFTTGAPQAMVEVADKALGMRLSAVEKVVLPTR